MFNYTNFTAYRMLLSTPLLKHSLYTTKSNMLGHKTKIDDVTNSDITIKYDNLSMR